MKGSIIGRSLAGYIAASPKAVLGTIAIVSSQLYSYDHSQVTVKMIQ